MRFKVIGLGLLSLLFLGFLLGNINVAVNPRDDTDQPNGERSGMALYTDYGTGCQYLANSRRSGLTPRMDANGKQICNAQ